MWHIRIYMHVMLEHICAIIELRSRVSFNVGDAGRTMNVHPLKHIPDRVRNWGPLWKYSCFPFESCNGHLKRYFHGIRANECPGSIQASISIDPN